MGAKSSNTNNLDKIVNEKDNIDDNYVIIESKEKQDKIEDLKQQVEIQKKALNTFQEELIEKNKKLEEANKKAEKEKRKRKQSEKILKKTSKELEERNKEIEERNKKEEPVYFEEQHTTNDDDDEDVKKKLYEVKKKVLQTQLRTIIKILDSKENINKLEECKTSKVEIISNNDIYNESYCCCHQNTYLKFNFFFVGPVFVTFYLIGVYQLLSILTSTQEELAFGLKSIFTGKNRTDYYYEDFNYEEYYENNIYRNLPDFNLLFLSSILGNLILKGCGYRISSIIYMFANAGFVFVIRTYYFPDSYNVWDALLILGYFILLSLSVGSIALFAQQIYFDGLTKYYLKATQEQNNYSNLDNKVNSINSSSFQRSISNEQIDKVKQKRKSFFKYLWIAQIPAYIINLIINYYLIKFNYFSMFYLDIFIVSIILYIICSIISLLIYCFYRRIFHKNKKDEKEYSINVYRICGYIIYCEKKSQGLRINPENLEQNGVINADKSNKNIKDYENKQKKVCCYSCKLGAKKFLKNAQKTILPLCCCIKGFGCFCSFLFRICCCYDKNEELNEYNQGDEQLCFCYKIQRGFSWFCDLLFKDDILDLIAYNIINELLTIGFQKELDNELKKKEFDIISNIIMLSLFVGYFSFFGFLNYLISQKCLESFNICEKLQKEGQSLNVTYLTISNLFFTGICSGLFLFGNDTLKDITIKYLITLPIASTKFYAFILMNSLLNSMDFGNIDLLSNSAIISLFLLFYKLFKFIVNDILDIDSKILIIVQFSVANLGFLAFIIYLIFNPPSCKDCCSDCCDCCSISCDRYSDYCDCCSDCCDCCSISCDRYSDCCSCCPISCDCCSGCCGCCSDC